ncbi:hypothetical protein Tco_1193648 [Tanacetum coccineum]
MSFETNESPKVGEDCMKSTTTPYALALEEPASFPFGKKGPHSEDSSLPPKFKDQRAPLISVMVGNITLKKALLDLGASINILLASLVDRQDLGTL